MKTRYWVSLILGIALSSVVPSGAAERHMMEPRVPADNLAEARALSNPLPDSADLLEKGKALYKGKGTCVNCHGASGRGDGVAAMGLDPSPRNFHHRGFWRHRSEGEIFWVIKHGIPGTAMIPFGGRLTDQEIWTIIQYERSFAGGRGGMGGPGGMGGMMREGEGGMCCQGERRSGGEGMGGGMMGEGHRGGMMGGEHRGMQGQEGEGECCKRDEPEKDKDTK